ncbi:MAG: hypothetical protein U0228_37445 [Myxococcaceae bacterium]
MSTPNTITPKNDFCIETPETPETNETVQAQPVPAKQTSNQVSAWEGSTTSSAENQSVESSSIQTVSPYELQQQQANEARQNALVDAGLQSVGKGLDALVADEPEAELTLSSRVSSSPDFKRMLERVPREQVLDVVAFAFKKMNPRLTEAEVKKLTATFARHVDQFVRGEAAQRLKEDVASQLHRGAQQFNTTAANEAELQGLVAVLGKLESPGASKEDHARAADLRRRLGLDDAAATVPNLRAALRVRAGLMEREARTVAESGETTLYRNLALHTGGERAGVARGSWASEGKDLIERRATTDERELVVAKVLSSAALGVASGGAAWAAELGAAGAMGLGATTAVAYNAPGLVNAFEEIDRAKAGDSAGTTDSRAVEFAKRKAAIAVAETATSAVMAGSHAAHVAHGVAQNFLTQGLATGAQDVALGSAAYGLENVVHPKGQQLHGTPLDELKR